jgi:hypothetical protein
LQLNTVHEVGHAALAVFQQRTLTPESLIDTDGYMGFAQSQAV